jgi:hypothetical protein
MIKVLILAGDPEARSVIRRKLDESGVLHDEARDASEMWEKIICSPFNGVILDVLTSAKAPPGGKVLIQEVSELYPTLRVRWDSRNRDLRGLVMGESLDKNHLLDDFLNRFCRPWPARLYRQHKRVPLNLNVLLSRDESFREGLVEKTVTLDISEGGCFLFSTQTWEEIDPVWVRFQEISDPTPIRAEIRRSRPWNTGMHIPGIGVQFTNLNPRQLWEICQHLKGNKH